MEIMLPLHKKHPAWNKKKLEFTSNHYKEKVRQLNLS